MIKTATDEDLKRIADTMFATQRKEFQDKLNAQAAIIEALSSRLQVFADAHTVSNRMGGSSHQSNATRITQLETDLARVAVESSALATRIRQCESAVETAQGRLVASEERMQVQLNTVLAAFAKLENSHGK